MREDTKKPKPMKKRAAKLAGLLDLPLDILFEIFGQLSPYDLLRLARSSKDFRRVLMHRSSLTVWKMAREISGTPECPEGVSEPSWANLAYYPHCHYCQTSSVRNVEWRFRVRICTKCAKERVREADIFSYEFRAEGGVAFDTLIPTRSGRRHEIYYLSEQYDAVKAQYFLIEDKAARQEFVKERKKIVAGIIKHAKICEQWSKEQSLDRSEELAQIRDERKTAIMKKLKELGWGKDIESIRYPDSFDDHKLISRPQRLTDRIWKNIEGPLVEFMMEMRVKRLEREHAALILERKKYAIEVLRIFKNQHLPCTEIMPQGPDFCDFKAVRDILTQPSNVEVNISSFDDIIPKIPTMFKAWQEGVHLSMLDAVQRSFKPKISSGLDFGFMLDSSDYGDDSEDSDEEDRQDMFRSLPEDECRIKMKLAATVYSCKTCTHRAEYGYDFESDDTDTPFYSFSRSQYGFDRPLFYPQVMGHACLSRRMCAYDFWEGRKKADPSTELADSDSARKKWGCSKIFVDKRASEVAAQIVELAGLDPTTATSDDMDKLGLRFICPKCRTTKPKNPQAVGIEDDEEGMPIFDWRGAVQHELTDRYVGVSIFSKRKPIVLKIEPSQLPEVNVKCELFSEAALDRWVCAHCRDLPDEENPTSLQDIKSHVTKRHDQKLPSLNEDYFQDFAALDIHPKRGALRFHARVSDLEDLAKLPMVLKPKSYSAHRH